MQKAELSREKEVYTTQAAKKDKHTYTAQIRTDGRTDRGTFIFYRVVEKKIQQHTQNKKKKLNKTKEEQEKENFSVLPLSAFVSNG